MVQQVYSKTLLTLIHIELIPSLTRKLSECQGKDTRLTLFDFVFFCDP